MGARLIAEIGADTSGFEAGLRRADAAAGSFGKKISGKLNSAFGAGLITGILVQAPQKLIQQAEEIAAGAKKIHTTTDEYQMLSAAAADYNMEVEEFIKYHQEQGTVLTKLIPLMEQYRSKIEMTANEIQSLQQLGSTLKELGKGPASGFSWLLRGTVGLGAGVLGGALGALSALTKPFGITVGGANPEDWFHAAGQQLGIFDQESESGAPLPLPFKTQQKRRENKLKQLQDNLAMLGLQEDAIKDQAGRRAFLWHADLTDRQQGGAYVARSGLIVEERRQTNDRLEEIRNETAKVKEEIQKLRQGNP